MTGTLSLFATDDELAVLQASLDTATPAERLPRLLALAWQLRQRDTARAGALLRAAEALLATSAPGAPEAGQAAEHRRHAARLMLLRGEADWLFARLDDARQQADAALHDFVALHDPIGQADSHWLRAMLAIDLGDWPAKDTELEAMARAAEGHDPVRVDVARAAQAYFAVFRELQPAQARWGEALAGGQLGRHAAAGCWAEDFLAVVAYQSSDFVPAIRHFIEAHTLALASGQPRRAVIAATNTGAALNHLNDYQGALEWMQRGLDLARQTGFPGVMAVALLQTAHTLRLMNRLDASREMLHEALALMAPLAGSRNHAYALWHLSEVELAAGHWAQALATFRALAERADFLQQPDLQGHARCGQARSLLALGEPEAALAAAQAALAVGQGVANREVAALQVLAEVHAAASLPVPPGLLAPSVTLHYLQQALALAGGIEGLTLPAELLQATAREHARLGDFQAAYLLSQRADVSRQASHNQEASNRAIAMQVTHQTDRARADASHQRSLAQAHAERLATLEQLGTIGQDITRKLELSSLYAALHHHVQTLLGASRFSIHRVDPGGDSLSLACGIEAGRALPPHSLSLSGEGPHPEVVRCARTGCEVLVKLPATVTLPSRPPAMLSRLHAPLQVGERLLGVMSIESTQASAYAERELAIFRTLCAYGAIALANAEVQAELVEKNRLLERLSVSDALTGLSNRLRLDQVLHDEVARRERSGSALSVVLLDLDEFKAVNDHFGHQAGDRVLVKVASLLTESSRHTDVVGRWGGEEFLLVCPDTELAGAGVLADKLRLRLAGADFGIAGPRTGSFGVASLGDGEAADSLMSRVDAALYRAKHAGRNRVVLAPAPRSAAAGIRVDPDM